MSRQIRPKTYWIRGDLGGDPKENHALYSGVPAGFSAGFNRIDKSDIPAGTKIVDMVPLPRNATKDQSDAHWTEFGTHIYAGEVIHLVTPGSKRGSRKASGDGGTSDDGGNGLYHMIFVEQQLKPEHWNLPPAIHAALMKAFAAYDLEATCEILDSLLSADGIETTDVYAVFHTLCTKEIADPSTHELVRVPVEPHLHFVFKLAKPVRGIKVDRVAKLFGIPRQQVEWPKSGSQSWDNKLAYLIHIKYAKKHQYDPKDVCTYKGEHYMSIYHRRKKDWEKGRVEISNNLSDEYLEWLCEACAQGRMTLEMIMSDTSSDEFNAYYRHRRKVDDALDSYAIYRMNRLVKLFDDGVFKTSFFYIQGPSRAGKSILAHCLCNALAYRFGWEVDDLPSSNSMDDYTGADIIMIDDVSASAMTGKAWLNLIDPNHAHGAPARFHNKARVAPRAVIITSTKDPIEFFYFTSQLGNDRNEAMTQFIARIIRSATVLDWRDYRQLYQATLPSGEVVDTSFFNVQVLEPRSLDSESTHYVEVKSRNGETRMEPVNLAYDLEPVSEGGVRLMHSPLGAMLHFVRILEERNPEAVAYGTYDDIASAMASYYMAAAGSDVANYGRTNLLMPANYAELPEYIDYAETPPERKRQDDEAARVERFKQNQEHAARIVAEQAAQDELRKQVESSPEYIEAMDEYARKVEDRARRYEADMAEYERLNGLYRQVQMRKRSEANGLVFSDSQSFALMRDMAKPVKPTPPDRDSRHAPRKPVWTDFVATEEAAAPGFEISYAEFS